MNFEAAKEMGPYELAGVTYDRVRRIRVPEESEDGPLM